MANDKAAVSRKGERIEIGGGVCRIEAGPALRRRKATPEALGNDVTAAHYQIGAPDAQGNRIEAGEMFAYLDYHAAPVFYLFRRREVGPDDPRFTPTEEPDGPPLDPASTNATRYSYVYDEVGAFGTEDEAVAEGIRLAGE